MATQHARVTVATTPTALHAAAGSEPDRLTPGQRVRVAAPAGSVAVFIGAAGVTTTSYGAQLAAGQSIEVALDADGELFAVVASATQVVDVLRTNV